MVGIAGFSACHARAKPDRDTVVVGLSDRPTTLDPRRATDANSQRVTELLFAALVRNGPDLKPVPEAASDWTVSGQKIVFRLKDGLRFHNGREITAADVVFSVNEFKKPDSPFATELDSIAGVEAPSAKEVVFRLKGSDAPLLSNLADVKILAKEDVQKLGDKFGDAPLGSGPYRFVSETNDELKLTAFDGASFARPKTKNLLFKFVRDDNTRFLKMFKGELDVLLNELQEEKVMDLKASGRAVVLVTPGLNFNYVLLNLKNPKFANRRVRRALFSAINRDDIVRYKLENLASKASTIIAPSSPFAAKDLKLPAMTLEAARQAIRDLGLEGATLSLKTSEQGLSNGEIIAEQLGRLGIKVNLQSLDWGTFYDDVKAGRFEMATMRWVGIVDPDVYRDTLSSHEFPPGRNRGYYSNPEFDTIVERARHEMDFERRRNLYFKAEQIIGDDLPILPLWYNANVSILNPRVKNFTPVITGSFYPLIEVTKSE